MLVLGFSGGYDLINESRHLKVTQLHDAAAVLVEDGNILFAIEEERLNRIKHTNKLPVQAIRACLDSRKVRLKDIDVFSYYLQRPDSWLHPDNEGLRGPRFSTRVPFFQERFRCGLGEEVDGNKFRFVHHHYAHAMSAFALSGYENSLVITLDGEGDGCAGIVLKVDGNNCEALASFAQYKPLDIISINNSLGYFYISVIDYLGYKCFDEYKVMGLAPYGDPKRLRSMFRTFYTLLPEGKYEIHYDKMIACSNAFTRRRKGEPFTQEHKDIAAALQEALEDMAFHVIRHYKEVTQQDNLCLAGGVAHNCTLNGKILRSGMFKNVFIQPASHDAGCALGAALLSYYQMMPAAKTPSKIEHVYWGKDIGSDDDIRQHLTRWQGFLEFSRRDDIIERTAELLANGQAVGWVQGRSEFGPRALGNRSILADARPASNKDRINQLVKKREAYRPFAPSVIEEEVETFFDVQPERAQLGFMTLVVDVKKDKRQLLGAVTHIDGTARIQTVSRHTNGRFWMLIRAFGKRTGVPVLLNTSFNNHAEPIVDSAEDAIICFLTTGLNYLVIGDYLVKRKDISWQDYSRLSISLPPHVLLHPIKGAGDDGPFYLAVTYDNKTRHTVSAEMFEVLGFANTNLSVKEIMSKTGRRETETAEPIIDNLIDLWSQRLVILSPSTK